MTRDQQETKIKRDFLNRLIKVWNPILITICLALSWYLYYASNMKTPFFRRGNWVIVLLFWLFYTSLSHLYGSYTLHLSRISDLIFSQILSEILSNIFIYIVIILVNRRPMNPLPLILSFLLECLVSAVWCYEAHHWYFRKFAPLKTAIIWDERQNLDKLVNEYGLDCHFNIKKKIRVEECIKDIEGNLQDFECIFLCDIHSHERNQIVKYCVRTGICVYTLPRIGDAIMSGARAAHLFHLPILLLQKYDPSPEYVFFKRFFDILLSSIALIVLSPLMLVVSIIIKATDGGDVFYRQRRETKDGRVFMLLKFRSMRMDAEKDGIARLSTGENDERITPIGRFIRKCRIVELPQLINIIRGDMSIVGPRPERPEISDQYEKELPEWRLRLQCKCGLTGYAQVYGQYNTTPYDKLLMDLTYIAKPSLAEDMKIIFATLKILFTKESTKGVEEGQTTASFSSKASKDEGLEGSINETAYIKDIRAGKVRV